MKMVKIVALGALLSLCVQHAASAAEGAALNATGARMEEMVVTASRLPRQRTMEEMVVVAKRIHPMRPDRKSVKSVALNDYTASGCACLGELGQIAVRAPSL